MPDPLLQPLAPSRRGDYSFRRGTTGIHVPSGHLSPIAEWEPGRTVVGALPFDHRTGTGDRLYSTDLPLTPGTLAVGVGPEFTGAGVHPVAVDPGLEDAYTGAVRAALDTLVQENDLGKVVLGRAVRATLGQRPEWESLLRRLTARNRNAWVFSVPLGGAQAFLGASPELLISRRGDRIISHPLAGSAPRSSDPVEDCRRSERLTGSPKDHYEHAFVVDMIAETLAPWCAELEVPDQPELLATDKMWHLGSRITGRLRDPAAEGTDALSLARLLHPTPAVAGVPTREAMDRIHDLENADRRYFAGTAGWCDADGDGDWVVSIRAAEFDGDRVTAWAGAGIVDGSDPDSEFTETGAKLRTILEGLGIVPAKELIHGH